MMEVAKVTSKGQITIPISIRRRLGINEGDKLLFINRPDGVMMVNPDTFQGDAADYATPIEETPKKAVPVAAATAPRSAPTPVPAVATPAPERKAPTVSATLAAAASGASATDAAVEIEPEPRRYIPPMDEPADSGQTATAAKHVGNLDLSTLLDDIRSIGSKI